MMNKEVNYLLEQYQKNSKLDDQTETKLIGMMINNAVVVELV